MRIARDTGVGQSQVPGARARQRLGVQKRGQNLRSDASTATNDRETTQGIQRAMLRLSVGSHPIKPPTDDPNFDQALHAFAKASPKERDQFFMSPNVPASTKAYMHAISPGPNASVAPSSYIDPGAPALDDGDDE